MKRYSMVLTAFLIIFMMIFQFTSTGKEVEYSQLKPQYIKISVPSTIDNLIPADETIPKKEYSAILVQKWPTVDIVDLVSLENLERTLLTLTKDIGARQLGGKGNLEVRKYLLEELQSLGFSESDNTLARQSMYVFNIYTENIVAVIPSEKKDASIVVVGAHFDTVSGVEGAIDNGSGVASLLEIIRVLLSYERTFDFELRFCFFSAEENGYYGASRYLNLQSKESLSRHKAFINADMTGFNNRQTTKALVVCTKATPNGSSPAKPNIISDAADKAYRLLSMYEYELFCPINTGKHDIVPFVKIGIPSATFSFREIDYSRAIDNAHGICAPREMHTRSDIYENIDVDSIYLMTRYLLVVFSNVADDVELSYKY